jgi:hypothetical protein
VEFFDDEEIFFSVGFTTSYNFKVILVEKDEKVIGI